MGNIHIITDIEMKSGCKQNIYITNDEEIKEGDWCLPFYNYKVEVTKEYPIYKMKNGDFYCQDKKIILTDNKDLIKNGVQAIDKEFLEWFVKNPSREKIRTYLTKVLQSGNPTFYKDVYKIIIPQEEPKQEFPKLGTKEFNDLASACFGGKPKKETLKEAAETSFIEIREENYKDGFIEGAKWQQGRNKMKIEDKITNSVMSCQIALNQLEQIKFTPYYKQSLKNKLNSVLVELIKVEANHYDKFFDRDSDATDAVYSVFDKFIKKVSEIAIYDMENICHIIDAYKKDQKSIEGIVNKINR
jgi:hypothetical protein